MQKITINKNIVELEPQYDSRQSFYKKAHVIILSYKDSKVYLLKSYESLVAIITENSDGTKWWYTNQYISIDLLTSQTTLRHIKEFLKQFYKNKDYKKADILKNASYNTYIELLDNEEEISISLCTYSNITNATSAENKRFFKNTFKGYKEKIQRFGEDVYLLTSSIYGVSNHYYLYINQFIKN